MPFSAWTKHMQMMDLGILVCSVTFMLNCPPTHPPTILHHLCPTRYHLQSLAPYHYPGYHLITYPLLHPHLLLHSPNSSAPTDATLLTMSLHRNLCPLWLLPGGSSIPSRPLHNTSCGSYLADVHTGFMQVRDRNP